MSAIAKPAAGPHRPALVRNAAALMSSTVASGLLTFGFWVVAARWFPADTVGRISALAASMALLAALAQLNLVSFYARFLPRAGPRTRRLILTGYGASSGTAVLLTAGFFGFGFAAGLLDGGPAGRLLFGAGVVASAIFFIQASVLTALGRAVWVPAVNGLTAAARLGLLPLLAGASAGGLLVAWALPVVVSTLLVTWWVVARGAPSHAAAQPGAPAGDARDLISFASAEYVNGMIANAVAFLPPVLVASLLGPESGAYFYLPWLVGVTAVTLLWNVVTSFVVEATRDGRRARDHLRRMIGLVAGVVVPGALVLVTAAGPLLSLLGPAYAAQGATGLRLIGLSLPFSGVVLVYSAFTVMEKRMWRLVLVQGGGALMLFTGGWLALPWLGIAAGPAALLASQAAVALVLLPTLVRKYRSATTPASVPRWVEESAW